MKNFTLFFLILIVNSSFYSQNNYQWDMPGAVWTHISLANTDWCAVPDLAAKRTLTKTSNSILMSSFGTFQYSYYQYTEEPMYPQYNIFQYSEAEWLDLVLLAFDNDVIYHMNILVYLDGTSPIEDTLVDFNASIGDNWLYHDAMTDEEYEMIGRGKCGRTTVLDTGSRMINSEYLKWINVSHQPVGISGLDTLNAYTDTIFEKIGPKLSLFPSERFYFLESHTDTPTFACYSDNSFPEYVEMPNVCDFHLGISDLPFEKVAIFPNPTSGVLNIKLESNSKVDECVIYNLDGRIIRKTKISTIETRIDLTDVANGVYLVKISEDGITVETKRIFKID